MAKKKRVGKTKARPRPQATAAARAADSTELRLTTSAMTGRVRDRAGEPFAGISVELVQRRTDEVIAQGVTAADGRYVIDPELSTDPAEVELRVVDAAGRELHRQRRLSPPGRVDLSVERKGDVRLVAEPLDRLTGPLLDPTAELTIEAAIDRISEAGTPAHNLLLNAAHCPLPPLAGQGDLLDLAWRTLDGNPAARQHMRRTLMFYADHGGTFPEPKGCAASQPATHSLGASDAPGERIGRILPQTARLMTQRDVSAEAIGDAVVRELMPEAHAMLRSRRPKGGHGMCPLSAERYLAVAAAAVWSANSVLEMGYLLYGLEVGLCGFKDYGDLHAAALETHRTGDARRLRGMLARFDIECGPDDGPPRPFPKPKPGPGCPEPPIPDLDPRDIERANCLVEMVGQLWPPVFYEITSVTPATGCPGEQIVISGTNFGQQAGQVCFPSRHSYFDQVCVDAESWQYNQIRVRIPEEAGEGELTLKILDRVAVVCGRTIMLQRRGNAWPFSGGSAYIASLTANGSAGQACVAPGGTVTITWSASPADATVRIRVMEGGVILEERTDQPVTGSFTYHAPAANRSRSLQIVADATNVCGSHQRTLALEVGRPANLSVQGMEVTQSIQHYRASEHLTVASQQGADNSVQLVASKGAWVRVYLRSGLDPDFDWGRLSDVGGTLRVERLVGGEVVATLNRFPENTGGTVTAEADPAYDTERRNVDATLNFTIPSWFMHGRLRLTVDVSAPSSACGGTRSASHSSTVDVDLRQTLRLAGIMVSYNGPSGNGGPDLDLPAPALADLQATAGLSFRMFPVRQPLAAHFRNAGTMEWTEPLTDAPNCDGCCSPNWVAMHADLADVRTQDGNQQNWIYYGLLPNGIPMGPIIGCSAHNVISGRVGNAVTMAHEIGHALGLAHAPCGGVGDSADPNYPAYPPHDPAGNPGGRIGEYGLDIDDGTVHRPTTRDLMGYCATNWLSLYHHNQLLEPPNVQSTSVPAGAGASRGRIDGEGHGGMDAAELMPQPLISIIGVIDADGHVHVRHVVRVRTRRALQGRRTDMVAELLDADGSRLARATVRRLSHSACGCNGGHGDGPDQDQPPPFTFQALLDDVGPGHALRIRQGDELLWKRQAPPTRPKVRIRSARLARNGRLAIAWEASTSGKVEPTASIRWAAAGDGEWQTLAVNRRGKAAELDASHLPPGKVRLQVLLNDGFFSEQSPVRTLEVRPAPPAPVVLSPLDGSELVAGGSMRLACVGQEEPDKTPNPGDYQWFLDNRRVGQGTETWIRTPAPGRHRLRLEIAKRDRRPAAKVTTAFRVTDQRAQPPA